MTGQEMERAIEEIWAMFKETDRRSKETDEKLKRLENLFEGQWGKLMESLVESGILRIFQERGIEVYQIHSRVKSHLKGRCMEVDVLLVNDDEVVVIEVKTTLKVEHVKEFLEEMTHFLKFFRRYKGSRIYAGVAALRMEEDADTFAYRQGLFVIRVGGDGLVKILNDPHFQAKDFGQGA
jgi:hypothetical protein